MQNQDSLHADTAVPQNMLHVQKITPLTPSVCVVQQRLPPPLPGAAHLHFVAHFWPEAVSPDPN
jgi:hypothetical protein